MRASRLTLAALVPIALFGCAGLWPGVGSSTGAPRPSSLPPLARLRLGMPSSEVLSLAGQPALILPQTGQQREIWYYDDGVVILRDGKVEYHFPESPPQS